jgi:Lrp/AsnC family leucine-responsive transcriptional regulator
MADAGIKYRLKQEIDTKDKKIMKILFEDGRMSIADISKKTGIRRDSVARRLKRLIKEKIITGFVPIINPPALGYPNVALLLLRTKTGNIENKERFLIRLKGNRFVVHISKLIGKYDFYCAIIYTDAHHLNEIIEDVKNYVANFVEDFEIYQVSDEPKFEDTEALLE